MLGRKVYKWMDRIQFGLFPPTCILCGAAGSPGRDLCPLCRRDLPENRVACRHCASPLPAPGVCGVCLRRPPAFDRCIAPFLFADGVAELITDLKFHGRLPCARLLASLLAEAVAREGAVAPSMVIPVPLHGGRLRERGFNQTWEVGRHLSRHLGVPLNGRDCVRVRATTAQSALSRKARASNLRRAFALRRPLGVRHVALLDDVMTTGATLHELAGVLKRAGVARVDAWCVARTPPPGG